MISPSGSSLSGDGDLKPVADEQIRPRGTGNIPAFAAQVIDHVAALAGVDQRRHVDVETVLAKLGALLANPFEVDILQAGHVFGCYRAARCAQCGDVVEQPILGFGRQVDQQTLGQPGCRCAGIKAGGPQRGRPVGAQVDGDGASDRGRLGAEIGQSACLEFDHRGLIDLVHRGAVGPGQPVGAGVQARCQDHHLPYARLYGGEQIHRQSTWYERPFRRRLPASGPATSSGAARSRVRRPSSS